MKHCCISFFSLYYFNLVGLGVGWGAEMSPMQTNFVWVSPWLGYQRNHYVPYYSNNGSPRALNTFFSSNLTALQI